MRRTSVNYDTMSLDESESQQQTAICRNCGTRVDPTDGKFCPTCGWAKTTADELMTERTEREVSCPVCWAPNPSTNLHCEECAARLGQGDLRVLARTERNPVRVGVAVVAVVLVLVAGLVIIVNGAAESDVVPPSESAESDPVPSTSEPPAATEDTAPVAPPGPIAPDAVEASSELSPDFGPGLLVDGDLTTAWNDASLHGDGATLTFRFATPATFDRLIVTNLSDPDRFIRNYRLREYTISIDGAAQQITGELEDTPDPQVIELGGVVGSVVTLAVVSTFAAEATDAGPGFEELAIAEVEIIGRDASGS